MSTMMKKDCAAKSYGLDSVNVSFLSQRSVDNDEKIGQLKKSLPLVITPRWDDSLEFLCQFLVTNRDWLDDQMLQHGALFIRGFDIHTSPDLEKAILSLHPALCDTYRGTSPRTMMEGTKYVFSAADVPVNYPIAQHLEMSFLPAPPLKLFFGCIKASKAPGGETALCDFRKVCQEISPELRHKLMTKKIKYTRRHKKVGEYFTYDVGAMLGWPQLFGTNDPREVERLCKAENSPPIQWVGRNKDIFLQEWIDEPFQLHPITKELVWFNHSQVFHWTTFPAELWYAFRRVHDLRLLFRFILIAIFTYIKYGLLGYQMALTTSFGDGTPITPREMTEIRSAVHKHMVFSRWERGDILCIDNFSTSHGRQPTLDKGRKVVVSWSNPHDKTKSIETAKKAATATTSSPVVSAFSSIPSITKGYDYNTDIPNLMAATPDSSPASTLTKEGAEELQDYLFAKKAGVTTKKRQSSCPDLFFANSGFWKEL